MARFILLLPCARSVNVIGTSSDGQPGPNGPQRQLDLEAVALRLDMCNPISRSVAARYTR